MILFSPIFSKGKRPIGKRCDMTVTELLELAARFLEENSLNYLAQEDALRPELAGLRLYDAPIAGVAAADSPLFFPMTILRCIISSNRAAMPPILK